VTGLLPNNFSSKKQLFLMLAEPQQVNGMNIAVIKKMKENKCTPLVITINQPYKILAKNYAKHGIDLDSIFIIDTVTQYSGGMCEPHPHVKYVNNPSNLTDLGIAITEVIKQEPDERFCIMFDSINMLLIHIPSVTASKFLHFVVNKLKLADISGIFFSVEKGLDPVIFSQMSAFVDKIVNYESPDNSSGGNT